MSYYVAVSPDFFDDISPIRCTTQVAQTKETVTLFHDVFVYLYQITVFVGESSNGVLERTHMLYNVELVLYTLIGRVLKKYEKCFSEVKERIFHSSMDCQTCSSKIVYIYN